MLPKHWAPPPRKMRLIDVVLLTVAIIVQVLVLGILWSLS